MIVLVVHALRLILRVVVGEEIIRLGVGGGLEGVDLGIERMQIHG